MINQWPDNIERRFSLGNLNRLGKELILALVLAIVISGLVVSLSDSTESNYPENQFADIDAIEVKRNSPLFHHYLGQIRENNGFLLLGTSETGELGGANYWHWFNGDSTIQRKMSVLGGAGRCADVYLPLLAESLDRWKGVEVLLFVNPTYWRKGLNSPQQVYIERYLHKGLVETTQLELVKHYDFKGFESILAPQPTVTRWQNAASWVADGTRSWFYRDFKMALGEYPFVYSSSVNGFKPLTDTVEILAKIDTNLNVSHAFRDAQKKLWFPSIDSSSSYRSDVLSAFIRLSQAAEVDLKVIIGPYNQVLGVQTGQEAKVPLYEELHTELLDTLQKYSVETIDLWSLSYENNSFRDYQHHSQYGAYKIYKSLKKALNENH